VLDPVGRFDRNVHIDAFRHDAARYFSISGFYGYARMMRIENHLRHPPGNVQARLVLAAITGNHNAGCCGTFTTITDKSFMRFCGDIQQDAER